MTKLCLTAFLAISLVARGQNNSDTATHVPDDKTRFLDSVAFIKKCTDFIKQVKKEQFLNSFILVDKPFSFEYYNCINELSTDTAIFTKNELAVIQHHHSSISKWTKDLFPQAKLISADTIKAAFDDRSKGWTYFYKHIGQNFNSLSVPIFLRNDTYCLFYSDYHCGMLCGRGRLALYRKEGNEWIEIKSYCNWIS